MGAKGTRDRRASIFLAVLLAHGLLVRMALWASWRGYPVPQNFEPLVLLRLDEHSRPLRGAAPPPARAPAGPLRRPRSAPPPEPRSNAITIPPATAPPIDWAREAELAAKQGADPDAQRHYRDLSSLSPEQLAWMRRNHMEPAPPGIEWTHPRVEIDKATGLPIIWLNDHCVLVMLFVFCGIGHIEPNGQLFKHMRDPPPGH